MTLKEAQSIKNRVEKEYNNNATKIDDYYYNLRDIEVSDFETKILLTVAFSIIPWLFCAIFIEKLFNLQLIPIFLIQPFCIIVPLIIGISVMLLIITKTKCKKRLKKFSNATTQKEKVEEATKYTILKKQLESINIALKNVYDEVNAYENFIASYFKDFEEDRKIRSKEEVEKKVKELEDILEEKKEELNTIAMKCALKDKFCKERDVFNSISNIIIFGMLGGLLIMMFYGMPVICLNQIETRIETSFLDVLGPFFIGAIITSIYFVYRRKLYMKTFQKFNEKLKEHSLTNKRNDDEDKQFDKELEDSIKSVAIVKLRLEKTTQELLSFN